MNIIQCGGRNLTKVPREIPVDASSVYLDNNNLNILAPEIFLGRSKLTKLFLNNSLITGEFCRTITKDLVMRALEMKIFFSRDSDLSTF